jgi:uncharacterized membrane protein YhaH (DUF805 family)
MEDLTSLLKKCSAAFKEMEEYRILDTYHSRDNRLTLDERLAIFKSVENIFKPIFDHIRTDNPNISDTDLIFCALSAQGFETVAIAECLTVSKEAVRIRKFRLREKLNDKWYTLLFGEQKRYNSESVTLLTEERIDEEIPLLAEPIKKAKVMKEKMSFGKAVGTCFSKLFTFQGRARRSEYWYFYLFTTILHLALISIVYLCNSVFLPDSFKDTAAVSGMYGSYIEYLISMLFLFLGLSVAVRRLHDIECSGWLVLLFSIFPFVLSVLASYSATQVTSIITLGDFTPETKQTVVETLKAEIFALLFILITLIIKIVLYCKPGTEGPNSYGPDPIRIIREPEKEG